MLNIIKCHFSYLISKTTLVVTAITLLIVSLGSILNVLYLDLSLGYKINNWLYFYNSFAISKYIIVILSIFIFGYSNLSKTEQYSVILIATGISRNKIFISKIITTSLYILVVVYISYFLYVLIGYGLFLDFVFEVIYLKAFINMYMLSVFFGLFSLLLIRIFDNIYTIIVPFAIVNVSEILNEYKNGFVDAINFIIPSIDEFSLYHGTIHTFLVILGLLVINLNLYNHKDIKI